MMKFFGISLPVVQITGGLVITSTAWRLLFEGDAANVARGKHQEIGGRDARAGAELSEKTFYPFTFPITAGPGPLVVVLTLSARASAALVPEAAAIYTGIALTAATLSVLVFLPYG